MIDQAKEDQETLLEISYRAALLNLACENPGQFDKFYGGITHGGFLERIVVLFLLRLTRLMWERMGLLLLLDGLERAVV